MVNHIITVDYDNLDDLRAKIKYFNEHPQEFKPVTTVVALGVANAVLDATDPKGPGRPPLCEIHGIPMKPSRKNGGWFCPHKSNNGVWCDFTC